MYIFSYCNKGVEFLCMHTKIHVIVQLHRNTSRFLMCSTHVCVSILFMQSDVGNNSKGLICFDGWIYNGATRKCWEFGSILNVCMYCVVYVILPYC